MELFYSRAHCHSYNTVFGDAQRARILISDFHTPQSGAEEFVRATLEYSASYIAAKAAMRRKVVNLQCANRTRVARKRVAARREEKARELALEAAAVQREKELWNSGYERFVAICTAEARKVAHEATHYWRIPRAATAIEALFRRYRVRVRFPGFRRRVLAQRQRRLVRARYKAALLAAYGGREKEKIAAAQTARRQYSRKGRGEEGFEEDRGGWKPEYDAAGDLDIWGHVWKPPEGSQFGVRNLKVKMPPKSLLEAKVAATDRNAWLGIPVMIEEAKSKERTLGPKDRYNTMKGFEHIKSTIPKPPGNPTELGNRNGDDKHYKLKYNWIPRNILEKGSEVPILEKAYREYEARRRGEVQEEEEAEMEMREEDSVS
jgi:hypothetical protein